MTSKLSGGKPCLVGNENLTGQTFSKCTIGSYPALSGNRLGNPNGSLFSLISMTVLEFYYESEGQTMERQIPSNIIGPNSEVVFKLRCKLVSGCKTKEINMSEGVFIGVTCTYTGLEKSTN